LKFYFFLKLEAEEEEREKILHLQIPIKNKRVCMIDMDLLSAAQLDFERHFGVSEHTKAEFTHLNSERVIVVENDVKRVFYSTDLQLLQVINLKNEE
jgi:hypothetical protein